MLKAEWFVDGEWKHFTNGVHPELARLFQCTCEYALGIPVRVIWND